MSVPHPPEFAPDGRGFLTDFAVVSLPEATHTRCQRRGFLTDFAVVSYDMELQRCP